jgi:hypothetical protein
VCVTKDGQGIVQGNLAAMQVPMDPYLILAVTTQAYTPCATCNMTSTRASCHPYTLRLALQWSTHRQA